MSGFKNFAVVGAGNIGKPIIEELLNAKSAGSVDKVVLLTRPESASKYEPVAARGATVIPVTDYASASEVSKALAGIDVVVCTISTIAAFDLQLPIARAAKSAGAQLFIPSEFGYPTDKATEGWFAMKDALHKKIREEVGIAVTVFFTGGWSDALWEPVWGLDLKSGIVSMGGDGNAKASFTSTTDTGRYLAHVLSTLSPAITKDKTFRIEAEHSSFNEIFAQYEKKHGVKLQVKYTPVEELEQKLKDDPRDILSFLQLQWARGGGAVGSPVDNELYPDWNPKPVIHYI